MKAMPNTMTIGQSYSDFIKGDFDWTADTMPKWNTLEWEKGDLLDVLDCYERTYIMTAEANGKTYIGTGWYTCGELVEVEDIELIKG